MRVLHRAIINEFSEIASNPFNKILSLQATRLLASFAESEVVINAQFKDRFPRILDSMRERALSEINLIIQFENNRLPHYAALRVVIKKNSIDCIFLDSANPEEHFFGFVGKLRGFCDNLYIVLGSEQFSKVQFDTKSCPLFAFYNIQLLSQQGTDQLFQKKCKLLSNNASAQVMQDVYGVCTAESIKLARVLESGTVSRPATIFLATWVEMPPEYVRYAQSVSCLASYTTYHFDINSAYSSMMTEIVERQVRDFEIAGDIRKRNMDMDHILLAKTLFPECVDDFLKYIGHCVANNEVLLSDQCVVRFAEVELSPKKRRVLLREADSTARAGLSSSSSSLWGASHSTQSGESVLVDGLEDNAHDQRRAVHFY